MNRADKVVPYAKLIAKLLQTDIDDEDKYWQDLLKYQLPITEYLEKIGLELIVSKQDEYAYIRQIELDEDGNTVNLARRISLGYEVSIICVLLREMLQDFEVKDSLSKKLYIKHKDLKEYIEMFFQEKNDKIKFLKNLDQNIRKIAEEHGLLKLKEDNDNLQEKLYQVKPIIKSKISLDQLEEFKIELNKYVESL